MATFWQKLFHFSVRDEELGKARASSYVAFPFSRKPEELTDPEFFGLASCATRDFVREVRRLGGLHGFDPSQVNTYWFNMVVERASRGKWYVQTIRLHRKNPDEIEVIGMIEERAGGKEFSLVPCHVKRDGVVVWSNGAPFVPSLFKDNGIAQYLFHYTHNSFYWEGHKESMAVVRRKLEECCGRTHGSVPDGAQSPKLVGRLTETVNIEVSCPDEPVKGPEFPPPEWVEKRELEAFLISGAQKLGLSLEDARILQKNGGRINWQFAEQQFLAENPEHPAAQNLNRR